MHADAISIKLENMDRSLGDVRESVARIEERTRSADKQGSPWAQEQIRQLSQRVTALEHLAVSVDGMSTKISQLLEAEQRRQGAIRALTWVAGLGFGGGAAGIVALIKSLL